MEPRSLRSLVREYLDEAKLMQLATSSGSQPWVCSVWFSSDSDLSIYWFSWEGRRHSMEIAKNDRIAGAIVLPQAPEDVSRDLQFQGTARMLGRPDEIDRAIDLYAGRIFARGKTASLMNSAAHPHKFYMSRPSSYTLFDPVNFSDAPVQELRLDI